MGASAGSIRARLDQLEPKLAARLAGKPEAAAAAAAVPSRLEF